MENKVEQNKEKFKSIVASHIKREGIDNLINWLENETDFFTSPSSTIYHGNFEGGLVEHSINVLTFALHNYNFMVKVLPELEALKESLIISSLFHDVCKVNTYVRKEKWFKDENNKWQTYIGWEVKDEFPLGHGEKSLYLVNQYIKLTNEEALAIVHHMGTFFPNAIIPGMQQSTYNNACEHPLVVIIHAADQLSTKIEKTIDYKNNS